MRSSLFAAALAFGFASAQTYTDCNPTEKTCPSDNALGKTVTVDFTKGASDQFTVAEGTTLSYDGTNGAEFIITSETQAPTISSAWYIFFGRVSVTTQAAAGTGIVSSFVMESDDLDEIDWEWLGGDTTQVESNYFGKGNTTTYNRAIYHTVATPQTEFHTYTIDWTSSRIEWIIDDVVVRTLNYADAVDGKNYPQTPMRVKIGNWVGGSSTAASGTVEWAGGLSTFPGTYTMYVKSVTIEDYTTSGSYYTYSDLTGSYSSITVSGAAGGQDSTNSTSTSSADSTGAASSVSSAASTASSSSSTKSTTSVQSSTSSTLATSMTSKASTVSEAVKVTSSASAATATTVFTTSTKSASSNSTKATSTTSSVATVSTGGAASFVASVPVIVAAVGFSYLLV